MYIDCNNCSIASSHHKNYHCLQYVPNYLHSHFKGNFVNIEQIYTEILPKYSHFNESSNQMHFQIPAIIITLIPSHFSTLMCWSSKSCSIMSLENTFNFKHLHIFKLVSQARLLCWSGPCVWLELPQAYVHLSRSLLTECN